MARMSSPRVTAVLAFVLLALAPAGAQEPGQGGVQQPQEQAAAPAPDYREEMRRFIQAIGAFARQNRRDFLIIPQNGLELLAKVDAIDTSQRSPARTYMRSIDGVLQEALYFGDPAFDKPPPAERQEKLLKLTELARTNGLRVLVMDYGRKAKTVNDSQRRNSAKGYVPFVAHARAQELGSLPRYPKRPFHENGASVLSLKTVRNFLYLRNSTPFGRQDEFDIDPLRPHRKGRGEEDKGPEERRWNRTHSKYHSELMSPPHPNPAMWRSHVRGRRRVRIPRSGRRRRA